MWKRKSRKSELKRNNRIRYTKKKHHAIYIPTLDQQLPKEAFQTFQAIVSLRPLTHDGRLDRIDDEFLRYYLQFGPLPSSYHNTLQHYRESLGEVLVYHMAYEGYRKAGTIFDALHDEPTKTNIGGPLDDFLFAHGKKKFQSKRIVSSKLPTQFILDVVYADSSIKSPSITTSLGIRQSWMNRRASNQ